MLAPGEKIFRHVLHIVVAVLLGTTAMMIAVEVSGTHLHAGSAPAKAR